MHASAHRAHRRALVVATTFAGLLALHGGLVVAEDAPAAAPATAPTAAPAAPTRPDWISAEEEAFLSSTGGLRPVATYDSDAGMVTIKLKKAGLTHDQVFGVAIGPKYDYYKNTDLVETSFRGPVDGKEYLFTGTVVKVPLLRTFVPAVTEFSQRRSGDTLTIEWKKATTETARKFIQAYPDRLQASMTAAGVTDEVSEYQEEIFDNLEKTKTIWGRHVYIASSGYYIYQQKVVMAGAVTDLIQRYAGAEQIKGAALKVAYQVLGEPKLAGPSGKEGPAVVDMSGAKLAPGT